MTFSAHTQTYINMDEFMRIALHGYIVYAHGARYLKYLIFAFHRTHTHNIVVTINDFM